MRLLLVTTLTIAFLSVCTAKEEAVENEIRSIFINENIRNHDEANTTTLNHLRSKRQTFDGKCHENERYDGSKVDCNLYKKWRSFNGVCNNRIVIWWGASGTPQNRYISSKYDDGRSTLRKKSAQYYKKLPNLRDVGNYYLSQQASHSYSTSAFFTQFARFVSMDISFTPDSLKQIKGLESAISDADCNCLDPTTQSDDCEFISIPQNDYFYQKFGLTCLSYKRSLPSNKVFSCNLGPRQQVNAVSSYLDLGQIYQERDVQDSESLTTSLVEIKFQTTKTKKPYEEDTLPTTMMNTPIPNVNTECPVMNDREYYKKINNQKLDATLVPHFDIWIRNHNYIVDELLKVNTLTAPNINYYVIWQIARKINIAIFQHIIFKEFLPFAIGYNAYNKLFPRNTRDDGYDHDYDEYRNPSVYNEFSSAAFRLHNMVPDQACSKEKMGSFNCKELKKVLEPTNAYCESHDAYIRGALMQKSNANVPHIASSIYNTNKPAESLALYDIMRGRDHGLPDYISYRQLCGIDKVIAKSFDDLVDIPAQQRNQLKNLYSRVEDIDLFVGGISEKLKPGSKFGPTFTCLIGNQFRALKIGDRHFYTNGKDFLSRFKADQLNEIKKQTMAAVLCENVDVDQAPANPFGNDRYHIRECNRFIKMNFKLWASEINVAKASVIELSRVVV